jgi:hypothetical protein
LYEEEDKNWDGGLYEEEEAIEGGFDVVSRWDWIFEDLI